jgi:uncharacterized membrane protein YphA (DoxX/SURF4 family)
MKIATYLIRFLLALLFVVHGIQKLFTVSNKQDFAEAGMGQAFIDFYKLLETSHYLWFVGFFQLLCGVLLLFNRTYLLAAVMLVPMIFCLVATHVFFTRHTGYLVFDTLVLAADVFLIAPFHRELKFVFLKTPERLSAGKTAAGKIVSPPLSGRSAS